MTKKQDKHKLQSLIDCATPLELELVWLPRIMRNPTYDELQAGETIRNNGIGLSGVDGTFISDIYKQVIAGKHMSEKQASAARKILRKYWRQYADMMPAREANAQLSDFAWGVI